MLIDGRWEWIGYPRLHLLVDAHLVDGRTLIVLPERTVPPPPPPDVDRPG